MKQELYETHKIKNNFQVFNFFSHGAKGHILKRVVLTKGHSRNWCQLAFGSVTINDEIDDLSVTNNGDRDKILATVANIVNRYTKKYPQRWVYFQGSTPSRNRLYRMAIGKYLEELSENFFIYGYCNNEFMLFEKNMHAVAFLIKRKINFTS